MSAEFVTITKSQGRGYLVRVTDRETGDVTTLETSPTVAAAKAAAVEYLGQPARFDGGHGLYRARV